MYNLVAAMISRESRGGSYKGLTTRNGKFGWGDCDDFGTCHRFGLMQIDTRKYKAKLSNESKNLKKILKLYQNLCKVRY